jgi:hypothetical protein
MGDNIKMQLTDMGSEDVKWVHQDNCLMANSFKHIPKSFSFRKGLGIA